MFVWRHALWLWSPGFFILSISEDGPAEYSRLFKSADFSKDPSVMPRPRASDSPSASWLLSSPLLKRWTKMNGVHQAFLFYLGLSLPCLVTGALEVYWEKMWAVIILLRVEKSFLSCWQDNSLMDPGRGSHFRLVGTLFIQCLNSSWNSRVGGGISVHKRRAWLMLNWHSFIGLHLGYLSYLSPGKTMLAAALTSVQPYFRHLHLLLSGKLSQICKVDIVVMALTKDILISLLKKVSENFLFFFWSGFFVFSVSKMSCLWSAFQWVQCNHRTHTSVAGRVSPSAMNTGRVHSSVLCPSLVCYWLLLLREEVLLTQTLSKFLKKIPALKGNRGNSSGSKKSLIFHL